MTPTQHEADVKSSLHSNTDFPPEIPVVETIGKLGLMWPRNHAMQHNATPLLNTYAQTGCPVDCGPDWSVDHLELLLRRGPHISAKQKIAAKQLQLETNEKIKHGYARIVKWGSIKDNLPQKLKISPIAMIPHKTRGFRAILDLSFNLSHNGKFLPSVNEMTNKKAYAQSMNQLGQTIKRIIATMAKHHNPKKPFMFTKLDIKDGFWRMAVSDDDAWNFCYVLPSTSKEITNLDDITIVVPNSLQMGWCESPPFFCSGTETARDVIADLINNDTILPSHIFEQQMLQNITNNKIKKSPTTSPTTTTLVEVFVDDFIGVTNDTGFENLQKISRAMIHGIHSIFPPPDISGHNGADPVSEKKLEKGEGTWSHTKEVLGWILNGKDFTMQLPPQKCKAIRLLTRKILKKKRISLKKFQSLAGKLQHASLGIPGGEGLFSPIQMAMHNNPKFINITPHLRQILTDWRYMIHYLQLHPTSVLQLIVEYPNYLGYSDACKIGAGGIWTSGTSPMDPILWQFEWPQDIQNNLVTSTNRTGTITMNDLELAGATLNWLLLETLPICLKYKHIGIFCDNTSAVAWAQKLRTSKSAIAARLLRMIGMRIHARQASSLTPLNIAGDDNDMADIASRAFKHGKYFEASKNLTLYFNSKFPLPQSQSWKECHIPSALTSRVIACLRGEPLTMASLLRLPGIDTNIGDTGSDTPPCARSTHSSTTSQTGKKTSSLPPSLQGCGQALTAAELKSKFRASRMRSHPLPRPSSWLENPAPYTAPTESTP